MPKIRTSAQITLKMEGFGIVNALDAVLLCVGKVAELATVRELPDWGNYMKKTRFGIALMMSKLAASATAKRLFPFVYLRQNGASKIL